MAKLALTPADLGRAFLRAQQLHEESWSNESKMYEISLRSAGIKAVLEADLELNWQGPLIWLLNYAWSDMADWSHDQIEREKGSTS